MLRARNLSKFQLWEYSVHGSSLSGTWLADGQVESVQDDLFICLETTLFTGGWAQLRLRTSRFKVVRALRECVPRDPDGSFKAY